MNQTLNYKKLNQLKEAIANSDTFHMDMVHNDCGTPACVVGHLIALNGIGRDKWCRDETKLTSAIRKRERTRKRYIPTGAFYLVQEIGFDLDDALRVYYGEFSKKNFVAITKKETLRELNRLERKYRKRDYKKIIADIMAKLYQETSVNEPVKELV